MQLLSDYSEIINLVEFYVKYEYYEYLYNNFIENTDHVTLDNKSKSYNEHFYMTSVSMP